MSSSLVARCNRWMRSLHSMEDIALDDPERRLEGNVNQVRSIRLDERAALSTSLYQPIDDAGVECRWGDSLVGQRAGRAEVEDRQVENVARVPLVRTSEGVIDVRLR